MKVKICGITRLDDALDAAELGADAIGFNFWPRSKRYLEPRKARRLIAALPPFVTVVGVFVNPTHTELRRAVETTGITLAQLHGDQSARFCARSPVPVIKGVQAKDAASWRGLSRYPVSAFLFDTPSNEFGGTGVTFDWALMRRAPRVRPMLLAGGLTPENVARAIRRVRPYGVDVASGVESSPGIKDRRLMKRFIRAAKEALP